MNRTYRTAVVMLAGVLLSSCAPPPTEDRMDAAPQPLGTVTDRVTVEALEFPLPAGEWIEVATHRIPGASPRAPQTFKVYASVHEGVIDRAVVVWVQHKTTYRNLWRRYQGCLTTNAPEVLYSVVRENTGSTQPQSGTRVDCWHVRRFSLGREGRPHPTIAALQGFAEREGLYLPVTMLSVRFAQKRAVDRRSYVDYLWNSDWLLPADRDGVWRPEDWNRDAVAADAGKTLIVERLIEWGRGWRSGLL